MGILSELGEAWPKLILSADSRGLWKRSFLVKWGQRSGVCSSGFQSLSSGSSGHLPWGGMYMYAPVHACVYACLLGVMKTKVLTVWSQVHAT